MALKKILARETAVLQHLFSKTEEETIAKPILKNDLGDTFGITVALSSLGIFEGIAVHFLVMNYSHIAAWVLTASTLYFLLWLWGDFKALRSQHSYIDKETLHVRLGLRENVAIELNNIASYELGDFKNESIEDPMFLKAGLNRKANLIIKTKQPLKVLGVLGKEKLVDSIGLNLVDTNKAEQLLKDIGLNPANA